MDRPTAVVTGGSGGIGRACVGELASDHDVAVHYHTDREGAEAAVEAVEDDDAETGIFRADLGDRSEVEGMVDDVVDRFGGVDVLVNNAGVFFQTGLLEMTPEEIETTLSVNVTGTIYCTRAVLPSMLERGGGRIVTVASRAGVKGSPTDPVYGASKGGVIAFTRSLARQYTGDGVFANAVAPGATDTKMYAEERRPAKREASPISRLVKPEEVADAVRFFVDTESVSGRVLEVDGGQD
ncbi:SDR family NAD(P)-dependent oxidoreductase [Salinirubellus sp. GCM10025818]|jgi:3-oxoacyl-[acyl-carrier protein] reductase|uniref:SDR family NAD(P)-dependent oxidoreductase n=1 Tax=Salinirubellus TaxID=2162630 RepID=UPI0030CFAB38